MTPPAATPPSPSNPGFGEPQVAGPAAFGQLLHTALRERSRAASDVAELLATGELLPQALCRYAAGRLEGSERDELQGYLARTPWAQGRVSALILGARPDAANPLAPRILAATETGPVDPYRTVAAAFLGTLDREGDLDKDPTQVDEPLARAACLLAKGDRSAALEAFSQAQALPALAETAKRLASLDDEDAALAELLAAV